MSVHTILVVADEPIARNTIIHALTARDFRVYEADSEIEAELLSKALGSSAFDLVIVESALAQSVSRLYPAARMLVLAAPRDMRAPDALVLDAIFLQRTFTPQQLLDAVADALTPRTQ